MKTIYDYVVGKNFNEFADNIVNEKEYLEDFKSFIIEILLSKPDYYNKLIENKFIDYVVIKIMTNQWRSNTSPFYKQYRARIVDMCKTKKDMYLVNTDYLDRTEEDFKQIDREEQLLVDAIATLEPQEQVIIKTLYGMNGYKQMSYRKFGEVSGINYNTIFLHAKIAKNKIKNYIKERL